jgi:predicted lipoprotein with Yx(FWY)xxD motif
VNSRQMNFKIEQLSEKAPMLDGSPISPVAVLPALVIILMLILAGCTGQAAQEDEETEAAPTAVQLTVVVTEPAEEETAAEEPAAAEVSNAVTVEDQALGQGNTVTVASVTADVDGWLVVHAQADGGPGPVLGYSPVSAGENQDVVVEIDEAGATDTLYAMLHVDAGTAGEYEFPGEDVPAVDAEGNVVTPPFALSGLTDAAEVAAETVVTLGGTEELGDFLVDTNGMTLYLFTVDDPGVSNCYDGCAVAWPPLLVEEGVAPAAGDGIGGELGLTERTDGGLQVTYNSWPLYFWINDQQPGDTLGQGIDDVWFVVEP